MLDNQERDLDLNDFRIEKTGSSFKMPRAGWWSQISLSFSIAIVYLIVGSLWVAFSDKVLIHIVKDTDIILKLQTYKGWFFVLMTSVLLYLIIDFSMKQIQKSKETIREKYMEVAIIHQDLTISEDKLRRQNEELHKSQEALRVTAERYKLAVESSNDIIWDWDLKTNEVYIPTNWEEKLGYKENEIGNTIEAMIALLHPDDSMKTLKMLEDYLKGKIGAFHCEHRVRVRDGSYKWILSQGKVSMNENGQPVRVVGSHTNITERKKRDEKIHYLAYYDSLTDLPNRDMFTDILVDVMKETEELGRIAGMMFLDLDNFKTINDTLGHISGDQLLKSVGLLLKWCIGENNIIARLGGDEFFILMSDINSRDDLAATASKIIESLQRPWIMDDHEFYITASIGIVVFPHDGRDATTLYRNADTAMYRAKQLGKNTYQFYTQDMNTEILKRIEMESYLRHALNRNEFTLYYQPQVDIRTGKIEGAEALIRWIHPTMGFVSPMDFIPLAEETGLILQIGEWVLYTACKQNKEFQDAGLPPVRVAVNLSVRQLQQIDFINTLETILQKTGLEPQWLELEITESLAMKDIAYTITVLKKIRDMGIYVSLDDFGTGYSSLNYLKRLPITTLKIDKSFVHDITVISSEEAIAKAVILLAHNMSLMVVAEGVETQDQFAFLKAQNCDRVQGYLFSKPVPVGEFQQLLAKETVY